LLVVFALAFVAVVYGLLSPGAAASKGSPHGAPAKPLGVQASPGAAQEDRGFAVESNTTVYITKTGKCYHRAGCQYLRQSCIAVSLEEATRLGKVPCSRCEPPTSEQQER
jgi:hypothetical protein